MALREDHKRKVYGACYGDEQAQASMTRLERVAAGLEKDPYPRDLKTHLHTKDIDGNETPSKYAHQTSGMEWVDGFKLRPYDSTNIEPKPKLTILVDVMDEDEV